MCFGLIIVRTCLPRHAVIEPRLAGRRLQADEIQEALLLIFLYCGRRRGVPGCSLSRRAYDPLDSLFEVVSATGTVGLSVGITSVDLPVWLKGVLCGGYAVGTSGKIIAWLVMLFPGTWFGKRMETT